MVLTDLTNDAANAGRFAAESFGALFINYCLLHDCVEADNAYYIIRIEDPDLQ